MVCLLTGSGHDPGGLRRNLRMRRSPCLSLHGIGQWSAKPWLNSRDYFWALLLFIGATCQVAGQQAEDLELPGAPKPEVTSSPRVATDGIRLEECTVQFISTPELSFEEAGVIMNIPEPGTRVEQGQVISRLNDAEVQLRIDVAQFTYDAARMESENDIRVRYAEMQAEVSKADMESGRQANLEQANVVPKMEMRRREAEYKANVLGAENARHERAVSAATARVKEAELRMAKFMLNRMELRSPISGIVLKKMGNVGEYVRPGDRIIQIGQLDRLRVYGRVPFEDIAPKDIEGRRVRIEIPYVIDSSRPSAVEIYEARIDYSSAELSHDGRLAVWVEIDNRSDFAIRPGMSCSMTIFEH